MGILKRLSRQKFLSWPQYSRLVTEIEHWNFIDATAKESIHNYWRHKE